MRRLRHLSVAVVAGSTWLCSASTARGDDTDEVEVSAFGGMHVRSDVASQPGTNSPVIYGGIGAGALAGVELTYRHDLARWSFASGLRVQYETYSLGGWLDSYQPNQSVGAPAPAKFTTATITTFEDTIVAAGVPLRVQTAHAEPVVGYVLLEPMIVVHTWRTVADYTYYSRDNQTSVERGVTNRDDPRYFAVYGALGLAARAGPGRLFLEVGVRVSADVQGAISPATGWSLVAGYRLGLR
jgi:hypothetical protein